MSGWSGFTDQELKKLKAEAAPDVKPPLTSTSPVDDEMNDNVKVSNIGRQQKKKANFPRWDASSGKPANPQQQRQSQQRQPQPPPQPQRPTYTQKSLVEEPSPTLEKSPGNLPEVKNDEQKNDYVNECSTEAQPQVDEVKAVTENEITEAKKESKKVVESSTTIGVLSESEEQKLQMNSLEQLQMKQKLIEDQNKKKQHMIQQTLQEKFKQTQSESQKLKEIHRELKLVDATFQADVQDLRDKIDEACLLFSHAQRRYEKAEKEYVTAKLDYFDRKETKDELTEKLYAIIQDNEIKKAKKLEELMSKLSVDVGVQPSVSPTASVASSPLPSSVAVQPKLEPLPVTESDTKATVNET